jgi:hypothetical protein
MARISKAIEAVGLNYSMDHIPICEAFSKMFDRQVSEIGDLSEVETDKASKYFEAVASGTYQLRPALQEIVDSRREDAKSRVDDVNKEIDEWNPFADE